MRVALCDDHRLFVDSLAHVLEHRGHQVTVRTDNPQVLLDSVRGDPPEICLLDIGFPRASGLCVAAEVRRTVPETRIMVLTGGCTSSVWDAYDRQVVDGLVNKAQSVDAVEDAAGRVARHERVVLGWSRSPAPGRRVGADELTAREREVLALIVKGLSTQTMATQLGVSCNTVRTHVQSVLRKLGVNSRGKAVTVALQNRAG
jgi:DNA-binding NarL/FixJ family response regulator